MATYNMLDILPLQLFQSSWGDSTTLWEIVDGEVRSTSPYTVTKSNSFSFTPYAPFPLLMDGPGTNSYDLSPYGEDGDSVNLQVVGRVSYRENITYVQLDFVRAQLTQNGDWLEFVIPYGSILEQTVDDISNYSPPELRLTFFSADNVPLVDIELQYRIEISISSPSSSANFNFVWETRSFQGESSCDYNVEAADYVSLTSAVLTVYDDSAAFYLTGPCVDNVLDVDGEVVYTEDLSASVELLVDGGNVVMYNWSHPEVSLATRFSMEISAEVLISGQWYPTTFTAISSEQS